MLGMLFATQTESYALFSKVHTPDYYENNARECFRKEKWAEGKKFLDEGWSEFGSMSVMNELMGRYYYHYKNYDKARYYLTRALRDDHSNAQAREVMVKVEDETRNYSSAICYINELLEDNPYSIELWRKKINIYRKQGNSIEADRLLMRLQQIYPTNQSVKNDVVFVNEQRLARQRKNNDVLGQVETLQTLVKANPMEPIYYQQLAGALVQTGRTAEAIEVAGRGAQLTGSEMLMEKRAAMLADQGRYAEAVNYMKDCIAHHPSAHLSNCLNNIEMSAARNAHLNDPYTAMAKVYARQHNDEALDFLLSTSLARGYYDDALMYIKEAKERRGESEGLLYKEFIVNRRLGNAGKAQSCLVKIHNINPKNAEVTEYLCEARYHEASDEMAYGQYTEAMHLLEFVQQNAQDEELKHGAMLRLFNCYFEARHYEQAHEQLELIRKTFDYENYAYQMASLLHAEGRIETALRFLGQESEKTMDPLQTLLLAYQYEEYALPYIKQMIEQGMIHQADKAAKDGINVIPTSRDILHMAITTSDILGLKDDYEEMVLAGRARFPADPFFIVKEAQMLNKQGDYAGAVSLLHPELNTFIGDSVMVGAFSEASRNLAAEQAKARAYQDAIATLDTALHYRITDRELLLAKGEIFEQMGQYDSAYIYQRHYRPTLMDYRQHSRHMEELRAVTFRNEATVAFAGGTTAVAQLAYQRRQKDDTYRFNAAYTSYSEKAGVRLGMEYTHDFANNPWTIGAGAYWGSELFPVVTAHLSLEREMRKQYTLGIKATYRLLPMNNAAESPEAGLSQQSPAAESPEAKSPQGRTNSSAASLTLSFNKPFSIFALGADVTATYYYNNVYFDGGANVRFYPIENSRSYLFLRLAAGNAPAADIIDLGTPIRFNVLNTQLSTGIHWVFTRHLAATLSATWHGEHSPSLSRYYIDGRIHVAF